MNKPYCEQHCGAESQCYAGGTGSNDWAGNYCLHCAFNLRKYGFTVWNVYARCPSCNTKLKPVETEGFCAECFASAVLDYEINLER